MNCVQIAYAEAKDVIHAGKGLLLHLRMMNGDVIAGTVSSIAEDYVAVATLAGERLYVNTHHVVVVMIDWQ